ncbi:MAG: PepSY domain-containing protein [Alphaproteobacteria bacterium]|nr:PepSY domain-containing protein [Alphaproteobacteria bacterium]
MKHAIRLAGALLLTGAMAYPAAADQPGADWMGMDQVLSKLTAAGYSNVSKIEADDGRWEGKAMKDGKMVEFKVDPHSGAVIQEKADD